VFIKNHRANAECLQCGKAEAILDKKCHPRMAHKIYICRIPEMAVGINITPSYFELFGKHLKVGVFIMRAYKM
jgi:hypothetical protein